MTVRVEQHPSPIISVTAQTRTWNQLHAETFYDPVLGERIARIRMLDGSGKPFTEKTVILTKDDVRKFSDKVIEMLNQ